MCIASSLPCLQGYICIVMIVISKLHLGVTKEMLTLWWGLSFFPCISVRLLQLLGVTLLSHWWINLKFVTASGSHFILYLTNFQTFKWCMQYWLWNITFIHTHTHCSTLSLHIKKSSSFTLSIKKRVLNLIYEEVKMLRCVTLWEYITVEGMIGLRHDHKMVGNDLVNKVIKDCFIKSNACAVTTCHLSC